MHTLQRQSRPHSHCSYQRRRRYKRAPVNTKALTVTIAVEDAAGPSWLLPHDDGRPPSVGRA